MKRGFPGIPQAALTRALVRPNTRRGAATSTGVSGATNGLLGSSAARDLGRIPRTSRVARDRSEAELRAVALGALFLVQDGEDHDGPQDGQQPDELGLIQLLRALEH